MIMHRSRLSPTTLALAAGFLATPILAQEVWTVTTDFAYVQEYIFRGVELADASFQPALDVQYRFLNAGVWTNLPTAEAPEGYGNEIDYYAGVAFDLTDWLSLGGGATYYHYPESTDDDTYEAYFSLSSSVFLNPAFTLYYDFELESFTSELSFSHDFELSETVGMEASVSGGYVMADETELLGQTLDNDYLYGQGYLGLVVTFSDHTIGRAGALYAYNTQDVYSVEMIGATDQIVVSRSEHNVVWSASVSSSFGLGQEEPLPMDGEMPAQREEPVMAVDNLSFETVFAVESQYVFRGVQIADYSFQPGLTATYAATDTIDLYTGVWTHQAYDEFDEGTETFAHTTEIDYFAGLSWLLTDTLALDVGATYYHYPENIDPTVEDNTYEAFLALSLVDVFLDPSATLYYDFTLQTTTLEFGLGYGLTPLPDCENFTIDAGLSLGGVYNDGAENPYGDADDTKDWYLYAHLSGGVSYAFSDAASASLGLRASYNDIEDPAVDDTNLWFGFSTAVSY